jgi:hypothetical protein
MEPLQSQRDTLKWQRSVLDIIYERRKRCNEYVRSKLPPSVTAHVTRFYPLSALILTVPMNQSPVTTYLKFKTRLIDQHFSNSSRGTWHTDHFAISENWRKFHDLRVRRVPASPSAQQARDPEMHWDMMMMLGPEGAQLPTVTPAGYADWSEWPTLPSRPAADTSQNTPGYWYQGAKEGDGEKTHVKICNK